MQHSTAVYSATKGRLFGVSGKIEMIGKIGFVTGVASLLSMLAAPAWSAVEQARVLSRTPVLEQVLVPRDVCRDETATVQPGKSGTGAVVGAIAGGVLGHQIGDGSGRVIATTVGAIGGAVIGDRLEPAPAARVITTRRCVTEQVVQHRIVGYDVVYELGSKQYQARLDRDPGETLAIEIAPVHPIRVQYVYVDDRRDRGYRDHGYRDDRYRDPRYRDWDRRKHRHGE